MGAINLRYAREALENLLEKPPLLRGYLNGLVDEGSPVALFWFPPGEPL